MNENISFADESTLGRLRCLKGVYAGAVIDMEDGESIIIGRSPYEANLVLDSEQVSRKHCGIRYDVQEGCYFVTDFSANGTFLGDGTRLVGSEDTRLARGSIIFVADINNMFILE